jgi:hypothetical protein
MRQQVIKLLKCDQTTYELEVYSLWLSWCKSKTNNAKSLQKALILKPLFNWWQKELEKLEKDFVSEAKIYGNSLTHQVALDYWRQTTLPIYSKFSKPLIRQINEQ